MKQPSAARFRFPAVVAAVLLSAAPALAEPVMQQAESWVIAPIAGSAMCSMKNTWEDGRKLVFARDDKGVNSIAVDFGGKELQAGRQYPLTLDLPPVLTREATAVAATRNVLLVGMGKDRAFYKALNSMQALYVTVQGKETGYDLSGSAEALQELADCASGKHPEKTPLVAKAPTPEKAALAKKLAEAEDRLVQDQARVKAADAERRRLKADLVAVVEAEKAELERKLAAAEQRLAAEAQRAEQAEKARAQLAADAEAQKAAEAKNAKLEQKLAEAQRRAEEAETELAAALVRKEQNAALEKKLSEAEERIAAEAKKAEKAEELRARLAEDLKVRRESEQRAAALAAEKAALEKKLAEAQRRAREAEIAKNKLSEAAARKPIVAAVEKKAPVAEKAADAPAVNIVSENRLNRILSAAGVVPAGSRAKSWETGGVIGSAEESALGGQGFDGKVKEWIGRVARRCGGDFAHTASPARTQGGVTVQKAEIACIGGEADAAAALVFIGADGKFSAVMHESATDGIEAAIARRDAVASAADAR